MELSTEPLRLRTGILTQKKADLPIVRLILFGVVLPLAAIFFYLYMAHEEEGLGLLPTPWHTALVFLVPAVNIWLLAGFRRFAGVLTGMAMAVAIVYSILLLPLLPISVIGLIFAIGALGFSPYGALYVSFLMRSRLGLKVWPGLVAVLSLYAVLEGQEVLTVYGLSLAASPQQQQHARGLWLLRNFGQDVALRNACEGRTRFWMDLWGGAARLAYPVNHLDSRKIWYQLHGEPYTERISRRGLWDSHRGSAVVGGKLPDLNVASSRIDGSIDAQAALSYTEWTLEFENSGPLQQEARAELVLPSGGVVSRATLWINGEEREAVFGERGKVRQAYEKVVAFRRDPLLVTTHGPGHAMIQCFPIQPHGKMRIRIGITAPLELSSAKEFDFRLPAFADANFTMPERAKHAVWIDYGFRGRFRQQVDDNARVIPIPRAQTDGNAWTPGPDKTAIVQIQATRDFDPNARWTVVIDASEKMKPFAAEIKAALAGRGNVKWLAAAGDVQRPARFDEITFQGGMDNVAALLAAFDDHQRILWIHAPQREELFTPLQQLKQQFERQPDTPSIYSLEVVPGPDLILAALDAMPQVHSVARTASLKADILRLISQTGEEFLVREQRPMPAQIPAGWGKRTSDHLARLWAVDQVQTHLATDRPKALQLAQQFRLVTPVSGAVVLETQRQYDEAGLSADPGAKIPTIPEPEVWLLMAITAGVLYFARQRKAC